MGLNLMQSESIILTFHPSIYGIQIQLYSNNMDLYHIDSQNQLSLILIKSLTIAQPTKNNMKWIKSNLKQPKGKRFEELGKYSGSSPKAQQINC